MTSIARDASVSMVAAEPRTRHRRVRSGRPTRVFVFALSLGILTSGLAVDARRGAAVFGAPESIDVPTARGGAQLQADATIPVTFAAKVDYGTGSGPESVTAGDFNGDGKLDLAVANESSNTVSVLLGTGTGTFVPRIDYGTGTLPASVTTADFNRDGKLDLVVANAASNTVSVLLGSGTGTFVAKVDYGTGSQPIFVTTGDFNGDGKPDLAVANGTSNTVSVLVGTGDGTFAAKVDYGTGSLPASVTTGDFNRDGKLDLAVANFDSATVSVLAGTGDGTFAPKVDYGTGSGPHSVAMGDFDRDGKLDLAVANYGSATVSVLVGTGAGTFAAAVDYGTGSNPAVVTTADVNGDGTLDLAVADYSSNTVSVLVGSGAGTFGARVNLGTGLSPYSMTAADFNGDGTRDLAVANYASSTVSVLLNAAPGTTFSLATTVEYGTGLGPYEVTTGDFNRDGKLDLAVTNYGVATVSVLTGTGTGTFAPKVDYDTGSGPCFVTSGDFNRDGTLDLAVANCGSNTVSVLVGTGSGTFAPKVDYGTGSQPVSVTIGDFNGDGALDLAVANDNSNTVSVLVGAGTGTFAARADYSTGSIPRSVTTADFNGDGTLDLAVANWGSNTVSVLAGNDDGTFAHKDDYGTAVNPAVVTAGDFNGDGKRDLAVANSGSNTVTVLLGNGEGAFAAAADCGTGAAPASVTTADVNRDGKLDLAVANYGSDTVSVLLGTGTGTFAAKVDVGTGSAPWSVTTGDFNGDGKRDLVVTSRGSNTVSVLLNGAAASGTTTTASLVSGAGTYGGTATVSVTLMSGGSPLSGKTIGFSLNNASVGSATTDASGVASLAGVSLLGYTAGTYPAAVGASFVGDVSHTAASGTGTLTVAKARPVFSNLTASPSGTGTPTAAKATPVFGNLTGSLSIAYGTTSLTFGGTLVTPTAIPVGQTVSVTIHGLSASATVAADGTFAITFDPHTIPVSAAPYAITYAYAGDANFVSASDSSTTLTVVPAAGVDAAFDPGANDAVYAIAVQPDGKILVGGSFTLLGGGWTGTTPRKYLGRLNADGTVDPSFDPGANSTVYALAVQPDGKILVGGSFTLLGGGGTGTTPRAYLGRLHADGSVDASFNPGANGAVYALAAQPDGQILVGGTFTMLGGGGTGTTPRNYLGRFRGDGSLDTFNPGANGAVYALALQPDGQLLVGGSFTMLGGGGTGTTWRRYLGRLQATGALDISFDPGANDAVYTLAVQPNGQILAGGYFSTLGGGWTGTTPRYYVGRLHPDGAIDASFNPGANNYVYTLAVQADGAILVGGGFTYLGGGGAGTTPRGYLGRLNADGSLDPFDAGANNLVYGLALQANGQILVGGAFTALGGGVTGTAARHYVGRLTNTGAALDALTVAADRTAVTWARSGTGPEVARVTFESSTDGVAYTTLGAGARVAGGWTLTGLSLPPNLVFRARGSYGTGIFNGSGSIAEAVHTDDGASAVITTSVTGVSGAGPYGGTATLTATVSVGATGLPGKAVHFTLNGVDVGDATTNASGVAALAGVSVAAYAAGTYPPEVGVSFAGDQSYAASSGTGALIVAQAVPVFSSVTASPIFRSLAGSPSIAYGTTSLTLSGTLVSPTAIPLGQTVSVTIHGLSASATVAADGTFAITFDPHTVPVSAAPYAITYAYAGDANFVSATDSSTTLTVVPAAGIDAAFDPGANDVIYAVAVQPDGKILVGGSFTMLGGGGTGTTPRRYLGRLNADGTVDPSFDPGANSTVYALAVQPDGKILVGGSFTLLGGGGTGTTPRAYLGRLHADGSVDASFNPGANGPVYALAAQPDGQILVGGTFTMLGGGGTGTTPRNYLGRFRGDGSLDTFNPGANGAVYALALQPDGQLLVGGSFTMLGGGGTGTTWRRYLGRLQATGALDISFDPGANDAVYTLAVQPDGRILAGGYFSTLGGGWTGTTPRYYLGRLHPDGAIDASFNPGANNYVYTLAVQADGAILVGGGFTYLGGGGAGTTPRAYLGRLNADGSLDPFDAGANNLVYGLALQANGQVLVGGAFTALGGGVTGTAARHYVGRLTNTAAALDALTVAANRTAVTWARSGTGPEVARVTFESSTDGVSYTALGAGVRVAGGWTLTGLSLPPNLVFRARGSYGTGIFNGSGSIAEAVHTDDGASAVITTSVTGVSGAGPYGGTATLTATVSVGATGLPGKVVHFTLNGVGVGDATTNASGVATLAGVSVAAYAAGTYPPEVGVSFAGDQSYAASSGTGALLVAQAVPVFSSVTASPIFRNLTGSPSIAYGTTSLTLGGTLVSPTAIPAGQTVSVTIHGLSASATVAANGTFAITFDPHTMPINAAPYAITYAYAGDANFVSASDSSTTLTVVPAAGVDAAFDPGANDAVYAIAVQPDGKILVGGSFTLLGGGWTGTTPRKYLGRLNADGTVDPSFSPGANSTVLALALQPDGKILVGGGFTLLGGGGTGTTPRAYLGRLNADGSVDPSFNPGANSAVYALAVQPDGKILVAGTFTTLGGGGTGTTPRNYLGRLHADGSLDASFDPGANSYVYTLAVQPDGQLLVGGAFTLLGGGSTGTTWRRYLGRLQSSGVLDISFDPGANNAVFALTVQPNGQILVGGYFTTLGGGWTGTTPRYYVGRLHPDGAIDASFNPGANNAVYTLAVQTDGAILVGGGFTYLGGGGAGTTPRAYLGRLNADGSLDPFDAGANNVVYAQTLQANGQILVGGAFTALGGGVTGTAARHYVGRLTNTAAALDALTVAADRTAVTWARSGTGPEVARVTFESSTDGVTYTALGAGVRVAGGWTLTGLSLPANLILRARGYYATTGYVSGSGSILETLRAADGSAALATSLTAVAGNGPHDGTATLTATVKVGATGLPGKAIQFTLNDTAVGDATTNASGVASLAGVSLAGRAAGTYPAEVGANFAGDLSYTASSGTGALVVGNKADQTITFDALSAKAFGDPDFTVGATASSGLDVTFAANGTCTITGATVHLTGAGNCTITALQAGDTNYNAAPGVARSFSVSGPTVSVVSGAGPYGGTATVTATLMSGGTPLSSKTISFSLNGVGQGTAVTNVNGIATLAGVSLAGVNAGTHANYVGASFAGDLSYSASSGTGTLTVSIVSPGFRNLSASPRVAYETTSLTLSGTLAAPTAIPVGQTVSVTIHGLSASSTVAADGTFAITFDPHTIPVNVAPYAITYSYAGDVNFVSASDSSTTLTVVPAAGVDAAFDPGANSDVYALAVQPDGKILVGGAFTMLGGGTGTTPRARLGRLNPDGSVDPTFNPGADSYVYALAVQPDGKILVGGTFTRLGGGTGTTPRAYLGRLNSDGSIDASFDPGANSHVYTLALQPDGQILVGGVFTMLGGGGTGTTGRNYLGRVHADGSLDAAFNPGADNAVYTLLVQADGHVLVGGAFTMLGGGGTGTSWRQHLGRLQADGALDAFDPGANGPIFAFAVQPAGEILVGGAFTMLGGGWTGTVARSCLGRLGPDGALDLSFDPHASDVVYSLALQSDGALLVGGAFGSLGGWAPRYYLGRVNPDGSIDAFDPGASYVVLALALQADGGVLVGGTFSRLGGGGTGTTPRAYLGRLTNTGDALDALTVAADRTAVMWARSGTGPELARVTFESSVDGVTYTALGAGARVAGGWTLAGLSLPANLIVRARGDHGAGYMNGSGSLVESLNAADGSAVLATSLTAVTGSGPYGGTATLAATVKVGATGLPGKAVRFTLNGTPVGAVTTAANGVAELAGVSLAGYAAGAYPTEVGASFAGDLSHTASTGTGVLVVAQASPIFSTPTATPVFRNLTASPSIAYGTTSLTLGGTLAAPTAIPVGQTVSVTIHDLSASSTVAADGAFAITFDPHTIPVNVAPYAITYSYAGDVNFVSASDSSTTLTVVPAAGVDAAFDPGANSDVYALAVQPDGKILVGGAFTMLGGGTGTTPRARLGRLNPDGSVDPTFNPGADGYVYALAVQPDGKILVGGTFTRLGGGTGTTPRAYLGRLNSDGSIDASFDPGANSHVYTLALQPDGQILVGGVFTMLGGGGTGTTGRNYLGRVHADGSLDVAFNPGADNAVYTLLVQADGHVLVGGAFTMLGGGGTGTSWRQHLGRLQADGALDAFDPGANGPIFAFAVQPAGEILVGGAFTMLGGGWTGTVARSCLGRLGPDGALDLSFDPHASDAVYSLALQTDGALLVGGAFGSLGGWAPRYYLGRVNPDGSIDAFDPGASYVVLALALQADGGVLVGGTFSRLGGGGTGTTPRAYLGRLTNTGDALQTLTVAADRTAVTWARSGTGPELARVTFESSVDGVTYTALGAGARVAGGWTLTGLSLPANLIVRARGDHGAGYMNGSGSLVESLRTADGSTVLATSLTAVTGSGPYGGTATLAATLNVGATGLPGKAVRFTLNGTPVGDATTAANGVAELAGVSLAGYAAGAYLTEVGASFAGDLSHTASTGTGVLVVAQASPIFGTPTATPVFRNLTASPSIASGTTSLTLSGTLAAPTAIPVGQTVSVTIHDLSASSTVAADGTFAITFDPHTIPVNAAPYTITYSYAGDMNFVSASDSSTTLTVVPAAGVDAAFDPGANDAIFAIAVQPDGKILVGGAFTMLGGGTGTTPRARLGRLNPDGSVDPTFNPGADGYVYALAVQPDGKILVGGTFTRLGGGTGTTPRAYLGRLNSDGSIDASFDPGANSHVYTLALQPDGQILVGGVFTMLGGGGTGTTGRNYLGRVHADGSLDVAFNPGADNAVYTLLVQADGHVLVGGAFTMLGGGGTGTSWRQHLGRLQADGALDAFDPGANGPIFAFAVQPAGEILVGGAFTMLGGGWTGTVARSCLGRLGPDGALDLSFDPHASDVVYSLALQSDGALLVGGAFGSLGGWAPRYYLGRVNPDGSIDAFDPGASYVVLALALQADGGVLVGGTFSRLGGGGTGTTPRAYLGRLTNTGDALDALTVAADRTAVMWARSGTGPELARVTFESSTDGVTYTALGAGARVAGGWTLTGLSLPANLIVRARGYYGTGYMNGSGSLVESLNAADGSAVLDTSLAAVSGSGPAAGTATLTATLKVGVTGLPGKVVHFTLHGVGVGDVTTAANGVAELAGVSLAGYADGAYPAYVGASFAGDLSSTASSGTGTLTVGNKTNQTITFGALSGKTFGDPDFTVSATASSNLAVTFAANGVCTITGATVHLTGAGSCTITALQAGDTNYNAAPGVARSFSISAIAAPARFTAKVDYGTGSGPHFVTTADFNADGKLDLATANRWENTVSVLVGNSDGTFAAAVNYATGAGPMSVTTGDFNADEKVDLAVSNYFSNNVSVFVGNGDGTFKDAVYYGTGSGSRSVTTGDFNGDGKLDLAVAIELSNAVSVLLGNGDGTFAATVNYGTGRLPLYMTTGDFNGDGKLDLALPNTLDNTVSVLVGHGDGTFAAKVDYGTGSYPVFVLTGDFNRDGKLDLAVPNLDSNTVSVLVGNGDGTFAARVDFCTGLSPYMMTTGDFNGDGKPDLAVTNFNSATVSVRLGNGDGTFAAKVDYGTGAVPISVTTGDFNGDGKLDLAVGNYGSNTVSVLLNGATEPATTVSVVSGTGPYGGTATLTATLMSGGNPVSGKTISFSLDCAIQGTAITNENGIATFEGANPGVVDVAMYLDAVGASFVGDGSYVASVGRGDLIVTPRPITVTADATGKIYGAADPALTYQITNGNLVGADVFSGGLARAAGETVAGSPYTITQATLTAGSNYALTFVGNSFAIVKATPVFASLTASQSVTYGTPGLTLTGTLAAPTAIPTGQAVGVTIDGRSASSTVGANGTFSIAFAPYAIPVAGSPHPITYSYAGGANFNGASDGTTALTVVRAATVTASVSGSGGTFTSKATLVARVTSGGYPSLLGGKLVHFTLNGNAVGTATTYANGIASLANVDISSLTSGPNHGIGTHAGYVGASFGGDDNYLSSSGTGDLVVVDTTPSGGSTWTAGNPMPVGGGGNGGFWGGGGGGGGGGWFYYFGGGGSCCSSTTQGYDPATGTWSVVASMPTGRLNLAGAAGPDGRVYAIGGWIEGIGITGVVEAYDPVTNTWASMAPMPTARQAFATATGTNGIIYAIGGTYDAPYDPLSVVEAYNPATNVWSSVASMPTARLLLAAAGGSDGKIYAIGGYGLSSGGLSSGIFDPAGMLATVEAYDPAAGTWTTRAAMPTPRIGLTAVATPDGKIYAIGGFNGANTSDPAGYLATVEVYDIATNTWTTAPPLSAPRYLPAGALVDGEIFVTGGFTEPGTFTTTVEAAAPAVADPTPPVVSVPANKTVEATSAAGASVTFSAAASDNIDGVLTPVCAPVSGATFPLGTTTVTCSATDAAHNTGTATFTVTVQDTTAPTATVPANISVEAAGPGGRAVTFAASATDSVSGSPPVTCIPASESTFAVGTTTVTCSATDAAGNTGSASFTVTVTAANPSAADGLIAWWPGDGNTIDIVGGHNGTLVGGVTFTDGAVGQGFNLPGSSAAESHIQAEDAAALQITGPLTLDAWVSFNGVAPQTPWLGPSKSPIVAKWGITTDGTAGYGLFVNHDGTLLFGVSSTGSDAISVSSSSPLPTGTFVHVAGIYTGSQLQLYVNGTLVSTAPFSGAIHVNNVPIAIGGFISDYTHANDSIIGVVDEVRLFNRALSADEIAARVFGGPVSWWKGEANALDSQDGNHGTWVNAPSYAPGQVGQAFNLTGTNHVTVPDAANLEMTSAVTMTAWINPTACAGSYCAIVAKSDVAGGALGGERAYAMWLAGTVHDPNAGTASTGALVVEGSSVGVQAFSPPAMIPIGNGCFTHVAAVIRSGVATELYINGQQTSTTYRVGAPMLNATSAIGVPLTIGVSDPRFDANNPEYGGVMVPPFRGLIDEVKLFSRALAAAEIAASYAAGGPGTCAPPPDTTPPVVINVPANMTVEATSAAGAAATWTAPTATDDTDGSVPVVCLPASGSVFPVGLPTTVTCTATDAAHNTGTATFTVTVTDTAGPTVTVPGPVTAEATSSAGAVVTFAASAADAVDGPRAATCIPASGSTFAIGVTSVTCTATDSHGTAGSASFTVTVTDTAGPTVTVPANHTAEAMSSAGAVVTFAASATDAVDGAIVPVCAPASGSTFAIGANVVTCTAADTHGNTASASFTVTVQDTTAPVVTVPVSLTAEATSASGAMVTFAASALDAVDGPRAATCLPASGSTFAIGVTSVTCTATDSHGTAGSASFTVTVTDTAGPTVTVPGPVTAEATSSAGAVVTFVASALDAVDGPIVPICTPASGSTFAIGATSVICTATDTHGNTGSASFTVTVMDSADPTVTVPGPVTAEATSSAGAIVTFVVSALDVVDGPIAPTCTHASGSTFAIGATTVTCTAADTHGNTGSASFTVTVTDTAGPIVTVPANVTAEATSGAGAVVTFVASATDAVDGAIVPVCAPASGSTFAIGATTVTCTAADTHGNTASASFTVTVQDTTAPVVTVPVSLTAEATSASGAVVTFAASALDAVDGPRAATCLPASGSTFAIGVTSVTCTATDAAHNTSTKTFTVTVQDSTAPALGPVSDLAVDTTLLSGAVVSFPTPAATDAVDPAPIVTIAPASGSLFPVGSTTVTATARDGAGNTRTATFTVTVRYTTVLIGTLLPRPNVLWPPQHQMVLVSVLATATAAVGPAPTCRITGVSSNEPDGGVGAGDLVGDWQILAPLVVSLRAERADAGTGRFYAITVQCTDASGNSASKVTTVSVPKTQTGG